MTLVSVTGTNGWTFTKNGNQVDFVPTPWFVWLATATYTVSDGVNQKTENISVTVEAEPNQAPTKPTVSWDTTLRVGDTINLIFSSTDAEWTTLTYRVVSGTIPEWTTLDANGKLTWTVNTIGSGSFQVVANDGSLDSVPVKVNYTVESLPNQAPVTNVDTYTTAYNTAKTLNPLANDSDPEWGTLTLVSVTGTNGWTFTKNGNQVDFVPTPWFVWLATATYTVSDGVNQKTENISVTVEAEPVVAPTAENFSLNDKLSPLTIDMTAHTTWATSITIISHLDPSFTITVSGMNINVTIPRGYNGDDIITYQATWPWGTTQWEITIMDLYAE